MGKMKICVLKGYWEKYKETLPKKTDIPIRIHFDQSSVMKNSMR